jgi:hypothetical protein
MKGFLFFVTVIESMLIEATHIRTEVHTLEVELESSDGSPSGPKGVAREGELVRREFGSERVNVLDNAGCNGVVVVQKAFVHTQGRVAGECRVGSHECREIFDPVLNVAATAIAHHNLLVIVMKTNKSIASGRDISAGSSDFKTSSIIHTIRALPASGRVRRVIRGIGVEQVS